MIEFEIMARGLYRPDQIRIDYQPALRMPSSDKIRAWMDTLWQEKLVEAQAQQIRLFDAPLFRLISASVQEQQTLHVVLGDTSYKEYVTTRVPTFAQEHTRAELGNALGVCSVVETSDGYILLDKRQGVDVYVGRYHVIGGFFERALDMGDNKPDPFTAMQREIREETGVQLQNIQEQYCLGVVYDLATPHGEMVFLTRLNISLKEVQGLTPEDDEIKQLIPLSVTEQSLRDFILTHHGNISATGEPNLLFYGAQKFGESWFTDLVKHL